MKTLENIYYIDIFKSNKIYVDSSVARLIKLLQKGFPDLNILTVGENYIFQFNSKYFNFRILSVYRFNKCRFVITENSGFKQ